MINIYALTDSHQECRNLSRVLSGIYNYEKNNNTPFLVLDSGDLFKGIYDKKLSVDSYLTFKKLLPCAQIVITLGNNDFGFNKTDFEFLKNTISVFKKAGINFVCSNLVNDKDNKYSDFVPQYKILNINGEKILITGCCVNNSCAKKFGYSLISPIEAIRDLKKTVKNQDYDKMIVLNHHWYPYSLELKKIHPDIDLVIGGHEHSKINPDYENNIFYPLSFARSIYKMTLDNNFTDIKEVLTENLTFVPEFEEPVIKYEKAIGLNEPVAKRVLNLTKQYSQPCPLGTFISDSMKKCANTDIAFHSTGFTMAQLKLADSDIITKYDIEKVICGACPIEKIEINTEQLKQVFQNATKFRMFKNRGNSRFVQCSKNVIVTGKENPQENTYQILQISIDGVDLLDEKGNPKNYDKKYSCAIDSYIGAGEQGFEVLKDIPKEKILKNAQPVFLNELFCNALIEAEHEYKIPQEYYCWKIIDI